MLSPRSKTVFGLIRAALALLLASVFLCGCVPSCLSKNDSSSGKDEPWHKADFAAEVTDIGQIYTRDFAPEDVVTEEDGVMDYVRNEVLLVAELDAKFDDVKALAESLSGEIVGYIELTGDYQIAFENKTEQELKQLIEQFKSSPLIENAMLNYVFEMEGSAAEVNDPWGGDGWSEDNPRGENWNMEAIKARGAWGYAGEMSDINIGIIDSGYDFDHEDLEDVIVWHRTDEEDGHGTHVLGTFAALANNKKGVTGTFPNKINGEHPAADVYTCSIQNTTIIMYKELLVELIARNVKVINISNGLGKADALNFAATVGNEKALLYIKQMADPMGDLLYRLCHDLNYDFVICTAAGNESCTALNNSFKKKYVMDDNQPYGWKYVSPEEEKNYDPSDFYYGKLNAKYASPICAIDNHPEVVDRIIVVGAVENNGTTVLGRHRGYRVCSFSNWGDRVDVLAPGRNVYSTVPDDDYGYDLGTSMATPHVSGVCAMVWAANNDLTGPQVKQIVCNTTSEQITDNYIKEQIQAQDDATHHTNGLLDAHAAVEEAMKKRDPAYTSGFEKQENGFIITKVLDYETSDLIRDEFGNVVDDIIVNAYPVVNGEVLDELVASAPVDGNAGVYLVVSPGEYELRVEIEGYEPASVRASSDFEHENPYAEWIKLKKTDSSASTDDKEPGLSLLAAGYMVYAIDENNGLWGWENAYYRSESLRGPEKIMDGAVSLASGDGAYALDMSNDLYRLDGFNAIPMLEKVEKIEHGNCGTFAVCSDRSLWGWTCEYQYGVGDVFSTPIKLMDNVVSVETQADGRVYAICTDGALWGVYYGFVRDRGMVNVDRLEEAPEKLMDDVKSFTSFYGMNYAIKTDGSLWCWGEGSYLTGEYLDEHTLDGDYTVRDYFDEFNIHVYFSLGNGTSGASPEPQQIADDVKSITYRAGYQGLDESDSECVGCTVYIIKNDGSLWGWGYNAGHNLGDGSTEDRSSPVPILYGVTEFYAAAAALAVTNDGAVWSWGGASSLLGLGDTADGAVPQRVIENVRQLEFDGARVFALKADDTLWGWGYCNYSTPLGDGGQESRNTPVQIATDVKRIAFAQYESYGDGILGSSSLTYIIKNDDSLWGWGLGSDLHSFYDFVPAGEGLYMIIGDGQTETRYAPVHILDDVYSFVRPAEYYQDALVITRDGSVWSWGVGLIDEDVRLAPVKVFEGIRLPD